MEEALADPASIPIEARIAGWLTVGFILDIVDIGRSDAPLLDALLVAAVIEANVNRFNREPALQAAHACLDSPPPDQMRRPVSINALASSLQLSFETVRRQVNGLIRQGVMVATPSGVYVPMSMLVSPPIVAAALGRYERVFRFHDDLRAAGVVEALPTAPAPAQDPQAPVRAVNRILSDYFFRTLETLRRQIGDPLTSLVMLDVLRGSSGHILPTAVAAAMQAGWIADKERSPVRVAELSRRLGIPYETARRRIGWLVERAYCRQVSGGILPCAAFLKSPTLLSTSVDNLANIRRMYRQVASLGVVG
jgi:predicted ArsR family transcriptional regulator